MTQERTSHPRQAGNTGGDPNQRGQGDEPMTDAQQRTLHTLAAEAGQAVDESLTQAQASKRIDELQLLKGRGLSTTQPEERARGDESPLASIGRAISAPLLDADDGTPPLPSHNGPPGPSGPDGPA